MRTRIPIHIRRGALGLAGVVLIAFLGVTLAGYGADLPKVNDRAPDFTLQSLDGQTVRFADLSRQANVVLVVLRGWPGYQCPICDRQVNDFISSKNAFAAAKARVVFVYPGQAQDLKAHADEFRSWKGREWPADFLFLLDPDYRMINAYGLRWDAPRETAYPSAFIIDSSQLVRFAKISRTHGGRATAAEILAALK
jgi:peroxiredoxin Q/BCP